MPSHDKVKPELGPDLMTTSDEPLERSALAKVSWRLLPLLGLAYAIAYMDRINISFAATQMNRDLGFSAAVYGLGAGVFFISYALFEVPSNLLLVRFGARRWIARIMLTWGVLAVAMMFVRTPVQFYIVRFLLGLAEAGFFPGVIYYVSLWFPAAHRGRAISRFYVAIPLSNVVMGLIAGPLLGLQGKLGLAGWQWLFLVEGLPAVLMSLVILLFLPESPAAAPWLSGDEKSWIQRRLATDAAKLGAEDHNFLRALTHPLVLVMGAINFLMLGCTYAFTFSAPELLRDATRLPITQVGYLISGVGLLGAVSMLWTAWNSDRTGERYFHVAIPITIMGLAYGAIGLGLPPLLLMIAYGVAALAQWAYSPTFWLISGDRMQPRSIAVGSAAINTIGQVGSFVAPYLWGIARDRTGDFQLGLTVLPIPMLVAAGLVMVLRRGRPRPI